MRTIVYCHSGFRKMETCRRNAALATDLNGYVAADDTSKNCWRDFATRVDLTAYPFGGLQILNGQVVGSWPPVVPATPLLHSASAIGRASYMSIYRLANTQDQQRRSRPLHPLVIMYF